MRCRRARTTSRWPGTTGRAAARPTASGLGPAPTDGGGDVRGDSGRRSRRTTMPCGCDTITTDTTTILLTHLGRLQRSYPVRRAWRRSAGRLRERGQRRPCTVRRHERRRGHARRPRALTPAWDQRTRAIPIAPTPWCRRSARGSTAIRASFPNIQQHRARRRRRPDPVRPGARTPYRRTTSRSTPSTFDGSSPLDGGALARLRAQRQPVRVVATARRRTTRAVRPRARHRAARRVAGRHRHGARQLHRLQRRARSADRAQHGLRLPHRRRRCGRRRADRAGRPVRGRRTSIGSTPTTGRVPTCARPGSDRAPRPPPTWSRSTPTSTTTGRSRPTRTPAAS